MKTKVLFVEDDSSVVAALSGVLRSEGYDVIQAFDGHAALQHFHDGMRDEPNRGRTEETQGAAPPAATGYRIVRPTISLSPHQPTPHPMKSKSCILTTATAALLLSLAPGATAKEPAHPDAAPKVAPTEALARLKEGNKRFTEGKLEHPRQTAKRRAELATSQHPFAIVLGCADSRTSPEVVFDQGLGDVFVVRVAGNVLNNETVASIEYAVAHLGAQLIVVLGHERCGAVKAAKETIAAKAEAPGHIQSLVKAIQPAVEATLSGDVEATAKANVQNVAQALRDSAPILKEKVAAGTVSVVGAHYDLDTGAVEFFKDAPAK